MFMCDNTHWNLKLCMISGYYQICFKIMIYMTHIQRPDQLCGREAAAGGGSVWGGFGRKIPLPWEAVPYIVIVCDKKEICRDH